MRLSELTTGQKGVIVKVKGHGGFRKRIIEMGFVKGKSVEVVLNAPLKDPVEYKILGYKVSLRRQEADLIEVISEEEARSFGNPPLLEGLAEDVAVPEDAMREIAFNKRRTINVALVGNPNCGKTSLFNVASGSHEHVGNYSGVTVDAKLGRFHFQGYDFQIVDLPGTYSLSAYSPEELYVRKYIIDQTPDVIINVVDASNLERNLYLTTQLLDMNVKMVIALNMFDELKASGNELDYHTLSKLIGVPMIPTVSRTERGIEQLFHVIINIYEGADFLDKNGEINKEVLEQIKNWHDQNVGNDEHEEHMADFTHDHTFGNTRMKHTYRHIHVNHGPYLEEMIDRIKVEIQKNADIRYRYSTRFIAIKLLENDSDLERVVSALPNAKQIFAIRDKAKQEIKEEMLESSESAITDAKYGFIQGAMRETFVDKHRDQSKMTQRIDKVVTHRVWGFPSFMFLLFLMFEGTFLLGDYPMQAIDWLVEQLGLFISNNMSEGPLKDMLVNGVVSGVGGVIVFLPNILILYFFISIMEDSGYMARAAFIMDKIMHKMGLHGKSFIPLVMGFGCNVPAVMATRAIENRKSRLITMLVLPFMSCSARLPLYIILIGTFFPENASLMLLTIYAIGIVIAVISSRILNHFIMKGDDTPFVMELPPYRWPTAKSIYRHTMERGKQYLRKMGGIILVASIFVWFLGYYPHHEGLSEKEHQEQSFIGQMGQAIEPVIAPLGFDWRMGIGLISGMGAKEIVSSTMAVLYNQGDEPLDNQDEAAGNARLQNSLRKAMSPLTALCFMLFVLIYFPCIATVVAIKNESGKWKWALFTVAYTTALAWLVAFGVFQVGRMLGYS